MIESLKGILHKKDPTTAIIDVGGVRLSVNITLSTYEKLEEISCDCICVSGNWTPTVHLSSQSGNKLKFNEKINAFITNQPHQNESTKRGANGSLT